MPKIIILALLLAACGADGAPERPAAKPDGVTLSGEARVGVVYQE
jgi:hypothetical protein